MDKVVLDCQSDARNLDATYYSFCDIVTYLHIGPSKIKQSLSRHPRLLTPPTTLKKKLQSNLLCLLNTLALLRHTEDPVQQHGRANVEDDVDP